MDMTLYRTVGALKRVALGDLAKHEFYAASVDERTGIITLQPVNIVDGATKRATADVPEETPAASAVADINEYADVPFGDNA